MDDVNSARDGADPDLARRRTVEFFDSWSAGPAGFVSSFREHLAESVVWDQRPIARTHGLEQALRLASLSRRAIGLHSIDVEMLSVACDGPIVHTERRDHLRRPDGRLIASVSVAGVLRFQGEYVTHWREYLDPIGLGAAIAGFRARQLAVGSWSWIARNRRS